jgi:hypothetical protein
VNENCVIAANPPQVTEAPHKRSGHSRRLGSEPARLVKKVSELFVRERQKINLDPIISEKWSPLLDAIPLAGHPADRVRNKGAK